MPWRITDDGRIITTEDGFRILLAAKREPSTKEDMDRLAALLAHTPDLRASLKAFVAFAESVYLDRAFRETKDDVYGSMLLFMLKEAQELLDATRRKEGEDE